MTWLRRGFQAVLVVLVVIVIYLLVTAAQILWVAGHDSARQDEPSQAIVVLGAAQWSGRPSPVFKTRLDQGKYLWEQHYAPVVVLTGGQGGEGETSEAKVGYTYLRNQGMPDDALMLEVQGRSTWQSLKASSRFLKNQGITTVTLVSDGWHLARASAMAARLGLTVTTSAAQESALSQEKEWQAIYREIVALGVGRIIGFDRLDRLGH
ncbi:YdcF family protein [Stomatohabitans albus]|uniref:YdcF family protein n=1 Tax=Stomatohabitans albus TaxID=3110766 RepID=UPI00300D50C6